MKKIQENVKKIKEFFISKKDFHIFSKNVSRQFRWKLFCKAQKEFREYHNNFYKPDFNQEEYERWNDYIREDWQFRPKLEECSKNRQFDVYHYKNLEASMRHPDKKFYARSHLQHDLAHFFRYLPLSEIKRITYVVNWLLREALKNYGWLVMPGLGTFALFDKPLRETHQAFCGKKWVAPRYRLRRTVEFYPSTSLASLVTPRTTKYMGFEGKYNRSQYIPSLFESFVEEKIHRQRGRLFIQDVFDKQWSWLGYSDEYIAEQASLTFWDNCTENFDFDDLDR